jgi:hypothetical protein
MGVNMGVLPTKGLHAAAHELRRAARLMVTLAWRWAPAACAWTARTAGSCAARPRVHEPAAADERQPHGQPALIMAGGTGGPRLPGAARRGAERCASANGWSVVWLGARGRGIEARRRARRTASHDGGGSVSAACAARGCATAGSTAAPLAGCCTSPSAAGAWPRCVRHRRPRRRAGHGRLPCPAGRGRGIAAWLLTPSPLRDPRAECRSPGMTNRVACRVLPRKCCRPSQAPSARPVPRRRGNPVRARHRGSAAARSRATPAARGRLRLLVVGGSLGAQRAQPDACRRRRAARRPDRRPAHRATRRRTRRGGRRRRPTRRRASARRGRAFIDDMADSLRPSADLVGLPRRCRSPWRELGGRRRAGDPRAVPGTRWTTTRRDNAQLPGRAAALPCTLPRAELTPERLAANSRSSTAATLQRDGPKAARPGRVRRRASAVAAAVAGAGRRRP